MPPVKNNAYTKGVPTMKKLLLLVSAIALIALPALAADGVVGKKGETLPYSDLPAQPGNGGTRADVEYNTAGAVDTPATLGGSWDGWGEYFIGSWLNLTGQDVTLAEISFPCGGTLPSNWVIWITDNLPGGPGSETFGGPFTPASDDAVTLPPPFYTYVDISAEGIMVPANANIFFGYQNPGIGGQIEYNGVDTYAWYGGAWDPDPAWGRTAVLQLKGNFGGVATDAKTLSQVKVLFQ